MISFCFLGINGRGISLDKALKGRGGTFQFASANHLWRATLEVLDFIPLVNVDYAGGLVITDWYTVVSYTHLTLPTKA